ncbi:translation initiation factor IF-2 [Candidatus Woesearchaeota archaeon]|nr:MAG: translation initiation factor IF-2 [Candidatus Woesearchaeota archaeon]
MAVRSPICVVVGHVDHGKSSILDSIRGTAIIEKEAGRITQAIGASIIPIETIKRICKELLCQLKMDFTIPGLLFIDTPGHAAFTSLRKRGGNIADIAILVVDINEGFKPQTLESIEILKQYKTPFIIAANKIDLIPGWKKSEKPILTAIQEQDEKVRTEIEKKLYELVGRIHELGFQSERFDRVDDYTKQVAIVPCSAVTKEGIPELLMMIAGLAQKFLNQCLDCSVEGPAKGTIIEVKEEKGLGSTIDVIIFDGVLKVNDTVVIGSVDEPIVTKVRALLEPAPLAEMRDKKSKFNHVKEVIAATGVKISAPGLENAVAGMPLMVALDVEKAKEEVQKEVEEVLIKTEKEGVIIKADTLGSLEALSKLLAEKLVPIRKAEIGKITKKDIVEAESNLGTDPLNAVILGFNVTAESDAKSSKVKILTNNVIYKLIEDFEKWREETQKAEQEKMLCAFTKPCKIEVMKGYVFRQSNPAIVGVDIIEGTLKTGIDLMKNGKTIAKVKNIQQEKESIAEAGKNKQVAVALEGATVGRQIHEGDILYSAISEEEFRQQKSLKHCFSEGEIEVLKEIAAIMRKDNPLWGI